MQIFGAHNCVEHNNINMWGKMQTSDVQNSTSKLWNKLKIILLTIISELLQQINYRDSKTNI